MPACAVRTDRAPWHLAGSHAVDEKTDIQNMTAGLTAIAEVVRLGRMHPAGPKRTKITLGGWSDFARLGSVPNAQKAAALAAKMVQFTFADGIDIDLEHLIDQSKVPVPWHIDEFQAWASFIGNLRKVRARAGARARARARVRVRIGVRVRARAS